MRTTPNPKQSRSKWPRPDSPDTFWRPDGSSTMTRGGRPKQRGNPERRCIATGTVGETAALIRFVVGPEGRIVPDLPGRLPGRGLWVSADRAALERAVDRKLFGRAARRAVNTPKDLVETVERLLAGRVVELLSLSRKAGTAVAGFEKSRAMLASGRAAVLFQAVDGSIREASRLRWPPGEQSTGARFRCLTAGELGLAFNRESVIHAAASKNGLAARLVGEANRLVGLRVGEGT